jgi:hypothetical protein
LPCTESRVEAVSMKLCYATKAFIRLNFLHNKPPRTGTSVRRSTQYALDYDSELAVIK